MKSNKTRAVIIIAVILIVLLAIGATFAVLYTTTDLFRSEKELFYKYMSQNSKLIEVLNLSELKTYSDKKQSIPHTYEGEISFSQTAVEPTTNQTGSNNNLKLTISGKSDPINQNESTDLNLKYADTNVFHVNTIRNGDLYGILSEEIITKYVAVKNENLKEFATKLGVENTESIPDKIDFNQYDKLFSLTEEQKTNLMNIYQSILLTNIPEEAYTKQQDVPLLLNNNNINTITYSVSLTEKQFYNIYKIALESSKNSEVVTAVIKEKAKVLGYEDAVIDTLIQQYQESIQQLIDDIKLEEKTDNKAVKIVLYTAEKQLLKTDVIVYEETTIGVTYEQNGSENKAIITINKKENADQASVEISKNATNEKIEFTVTINSVSDDEEAKIVCKMVKEGNISSNEIKDAISFGINDGTTMYRIDYTNAENYSENINVQKLDASNSVTLNGYQAEEIQNLLAAIMMRLQQVMQEKSQILQSAGLIIPGNEQNTVSEQEVSAFNSQFMAFSGSDVTGSTVKNLLSQIITSNSTYQDKQIAVEFGQYTGVSDVETITGISNLVNSTSKYSVSLEYGLDGFVNKIAIKEKI